MKILDTSGETVVEYTYDAWGNCVFDPDSTTNRTLAVNNPFRYRSYYYDKDSKLYFLQSRYYDPSIGRFISSDDIAYLGATGTILSYNMFAYCENNVVNGKDPDGYWNKTTVAGVLDIAVTIASLFIPATGWLSITLKSAATAYFATRIVMASIDLQKARNWMQSHSAALSIGINIINIIGTWLRIPGRNIAKSYMGRYIFNAIYRVWGTSFSNAVSLIDIIGSL